MRASRYRHGTCLGPDGDATSAVNFDVTLGSAQEPGHIEHRYLPSFGNRRKDGRWDQRITMLGYLLRRILAAVPVMGVVALFVFLAAAADAG